MRNNAYTCFVDGNLPLPPMLVHRLSWIRLVGVHSISDAKPWSLRGFFRSTYLGLRVPPSLLLAIQTQIPISGIAKGMMDAAACLAPLVTTYCVCCARFWPRNVLTIWFLKSNGRNSRSGSAFMPIEPWTPSRDYPRPSPTMKLKFPLLFF